MPSIPNVVNDCQSQSKRRQEHIRLLTSKGRLLKVISNLIYMSQIYLQLREVVKLLFQITAKIHSAIFHANQLHIRAFELYLKHEKAKLSYRPHCKHFIPKVNIFKLLKIFFFKFSVCTCVVHKRCHQSVVTKCPGMKDTTQQDEVSEVNYHFIYFLN